MSRSFVTLRKYGSRIARAVLWSVLPLRVDLRRLCPAPASDASVLWARRGRTEFFGQGGASIG